MAEEPQTQTDAEETSENDENQSSTEATDDKQERSSSENLKVLENIDVKLTVEVGSTENNHQN